MTLTWRPLHPTTPQDVLRHRRLTQQEEVPESPDKFVNSAKVAYLMERRKRELRILNLLAGAILAHGQGNASSEALFTSYADVRATSMGERVGRMMRSTLAEALGGPLESESEALKHPHQILHFILPRSIAVSLTGAKQTRKGRGGTRTARDRATDRPSEEEDNE